MKLDARKSATLHEECFVALSPGQAGLFLLIRKMTTDKVLADLKGVGGGVMKTASDHTREEALREALAGPPDRDGASGDFPGCASVKSPLTRLQFSLAAVRSCDIEAPRRPLPCFLET
jgi:hypothetical protein